MSSAQTFTWLAYDRFWAICLLGVSVVLLPSRCVHGQDLMGEVKVGLEVGDMAPEIIGEDVDGKRFKLSDYRGKVVMLDFWGDW